MFIASGDDGSLEPEQKSVKRALDALRAVGCRIGGFFTISMQRVNFPIALALNTGTFLRRPDAKLQTRRAPRRGMNQRDDHKGTSALARVYTQFSQTMNGHSTSSRSSNTYALLANSARAHGYGVAGRLSR